MSDKTNPPLGGFVLSQYRHLNISSACVIEGYGLALHRKSHFVFTIILTKILIRG